jgi:hypothetical protein
VRIMLVPSLLVTQSGNQIAKTELCLNLCLWVESSVKSHLRKACKELDASDLAAFVGNRE